MTFKKKTIGILGGGQLGKMTAIAATMGSGAALGGCSYCYYVGALGFIVGWQVLLVPCALSLAVCLTVSVSKALKEKKIKESSQ